MVVSGSTNGTCARDPREEIHVGHRAHQQTARALLPYATSCCWEVSPVSTRCLATAMKSVNVFFLSSSLPFSAHSLPSSPPPRTWGDDEHQSRDPAATTERWKTADPHRSQRRRSHRSSRCREFDIGSVHYRDRDPVPPFSLQQPSHAAHYSLRR